MASGTYTEWYTAHQRLGTILAGQASAKNRIREYSQKISDFLDDARKTGNWDGEKIREYVECIRLATNHEHDLEKKAKELEQLKAESDHEFYKELEQLKAESDHEFYVEEDSQLIKDMERQMREAFFLGDKASSVSHDEASAARETRSYYPSCYTPLKATYGGPGTAQRGYTVHYHGTDGAPHTKKVSRTVAERMVPHLFGGETTYRFVVEGEAWAEGVWTPNATLRVDRDSTSRITMGRWTATVDFPPEFEKYFQETPTKEGTGMSMLVMSARENVDKHFKEADDLAAHDRKSLIQARRNVTDAILAYNEVADACGEPRIEYPWPV